METVPHYPKVSEKVVKMSWSWSCKFHCLSNQVQNNAAICLTHSYIQIRAPELLLQLCHCLNLHFNKLCHQGAQDHKVFLQHIQTCYYFWFIDFRLCVYTICVPKPFNVPVCRYQLFSLPLVPNQDRPLCRSSDGQPWLKTHSRNSPIALAT